jgi:hypothetical protein
MVTPRPAAPIPDAMLRVLGWLSLLAMLAWFFGPLLGAFERPTAWAIILVALIAFPLVLAGLHLSLASHLSRADRERWSSGLLRFGPFVAWLYLITKHKSGG